MVFTSSPILPESKVSLALPQTMFYSFPDIPIFPFIPLTFPLVTHRYQPCFGYTSNTVDLRDLKMDKPLILNKTIHPCVGLFTSFFLSSLAPPAQDPHTTFLLQMNSSWHRPQSQSELERNHVIKVDPRTVIKG